MGGEHFSVSKNARLSSRGVILWVHALANDCQIDYANDCVFQVKLLSSYQNSQWELLPPPPFIGLKCLQNILTFAVFAATAQVLGRPYKKRDLIDQFPIYEP